MNNSPPEDFGQKETTYIQGYGFANDMISDGRRIRGYANIFGVAFILFVLLQYSVPLMFVALFKLFFPAIRVYDKLVLAPDETLISIDILSSTICYFVPLLFILLLIRGSGRVNLRRASFKVLLPCIFLLPFTSLVGSYISAALSSLLSRFGLVPKGPDISPAENALSFILLTVAVALLPAIFEELLFRYVLQGSLSRFGGRFALIVSTILFALMHRNLVQLPAALISGFMLGLIFLKTGSLLLVITCHFINNFVPLVLESVSRRLPDETAVAVFLAWGVSVLLLGLVSVMVLALRDRFFSLRQLPSAHNALPAAVARREDRIKLRSFFFSIPVALLLAVLALSIVLNMVL